MNQVCVMYVHVYTCTYVRMYIGIADTTVASAREHVETCTPGAHELPRVCVGHHTDVKFNVTKAHCLAGLLME